MGPPPERLPSTCILVNCFDYESYVCEAVRSALKQSLPPDEVVVVDDGSTDGSLERLRQEFGREERVRIETKPNGGQLSAINAAAPWITADLVLLLDADDGYRDDHVERTVRFFASRPTCDFLACGYEFFGAFSRTVQRFPRDRDLGFSTLDVLFHRAWIGGPTSSLAMRRWVLDRLLPLPFEEEWPLRADDCLVWGSSLVGAHKFYRSAPTVLRRVHEANGFYGRLESEDERYRYLLRRNRFVEALVRREGLDRDSLVDHLYDEYCTAELPRPAREHRRYLRLVDRLPRDRRWQRRMRRKLARHAGPWWRPRASRPRPVRGRTPAQLLEAPAVTERP